MDTPSIVLVIETVKERERASEAYMLVPLISYL